jgi:hypothetical protein
MVVPKRANMAWHSAVHVLALSLSRHGLAT